MMSADLHPPLFNALMFVWIRIFGDSEISVRMLPLICGLLTIVLAARLAIDYGWRSAAAVAALVMAISPAHIWYSQESRSYSFQSMLIVASVLAFHCVQATHATRWYVAYAALAACMVFTQYPTAVYVAAIMLLALRDPRGRVRMLSIGVAIAVLLAVFLAVKWRLGAVPTGAGYLQGFGIADLWNLMFDWLIVGGALGQPGARPIAVRIGVLVAQLALLVLAARGLIKARALRGELALLLFCLPIALLAVDLVGAEHFYIERTGLSVLPFLAIAIGIGVASMTRTLWRVSSVALVATFGTVVLVNYYAKSDRSTVYKPNADWRSAARMLAGEHARSGRPVVVVAMTPALELRYYNDGFGPRRLDEPPVEPSTTVRGGIRERLKHVFVVPDEPLRGQVGRIYEPGEPNVSVVHRILDRERAAEVFLARNQYWLGTSDRLIESVQADATLRIEPVFEAKGIRLLRIRPVHVQVTQFP
jgi:mannosyltransferase